MNGDKSVEEIKKTAVGAAKEAVQEVKESVEATAEDMENVPEVHLETPEADVEVTFIDDRDKEAEGLIHWAAARAGVIVAAPLLGTVSLIANEVYMISKIESGSFLYRFFRGNRCRHNRCYTFTDSIYPDSHRDFRNLWIGKSGRPLD